MLLNNDHILEDNAFHTQMKNEESEDEDKLLIDFGIHVLKTKDFLGLLSFMYYL